MAATDRAEPAAGVFPSGQKMKPAGTHRWKFFLRCLPSVFLNEKLGNTYRLDGGEADGSALVGLFPNVADDGGSTFFGPLPPQKKNPKFQLESSKTKFPKF